MADFVYSDDHNMKPIRDRRLNNLVFASGLHKHMKLMIPAKATEADMTKFHNPKYVRFLREITPEKTKQYPAQ